MKWPFHVQKYMHVQAHTWVWDCMLLVSVSLHVSCTEPQEAIIWHFKVLMHNPVWIHLHLKPTDWEREGGKSRPGEESECNASWGKTLTMCNIKCALKSMWIVCVWRSKITWVIFLTILPPSISTSLSLYYSVYVHLPFFFFFFLEEILRKALTGMPWWDSFMHGKLTNRLCYTSQIDAHFFNVFIYFNVFYFCPYLLRFRSDLLETFL